MVLNAEMSGKNLGLEMVETKLEVMDEVAKIGANYQPIKNYIVEETDSYLENLL